MQGQRQVSAGEAGLRCGGGGGPETLALHSGGRGRRPEAGAVVRVAAGSGAAGDRPGSCRRSSRWEGRLARDSDGGRPGGPPGLSSGGPGDSDGRPVCARLPEVTRASGVCERGRPGASGPGTGETRGIPGILGALGAAGAERTGSGPCRREVGGGETEGGRGPG